MTVGKKLDSIIKKIFGIFKIDISDSKTAVISQFVKFGIVGVSNTLLSYGIYLLVLFMMKPLNISWDAYVGSVVSFFLSVLWSFFWNNKYVFKSDKGERNLFKALIKTYISYGFTGFILANILLFVWIDLEYSQNHSSADKPADYSSGKFPSKQVLGFQDKENRKGSGKADLTFYNFIAIFLSFDICSSFRYFLFFDSKVVKIDIFA